MPPIKPILKFTWPVFGSSLALTLITGCAGTNWSQVGSSVITDVQQGTVLATEAYAAYSAVNQQLTTANVTTGKLDATKVLAAATAINSGLQTPGLASAVTSFVSDANATITALKGTGATVPATIAAVSNQGAATVSTVAAVAPVSSSPPVPTTYCAPLVPHSILSESPGEYAAMHADASLVAGN